MSRKIRSLKIFLRLQRRLDHLQRIAKRTCWSDYVSRTDLSLPLLSSRKKIVTLPMCWSFFIIWRSCTHSWKRLKMRYGSLRNVAIHFIEFKSVKNAFYSSTLVTRASRAPIFCIFAVSFDTIQKCCKSVVFVFDFIFDKRQKDGHSHHTFGFIFDVRQRWSQSYQPIWQRSL